MNELEKTAAKQRLTNRLKEKIAEGFLNRMKEGFKTLVNLPTVGQRVRNQASAYGTPKAPTAPKPPKALLPGALNSAAKTMPGVPGMLPSAATRVVKGMTR